MPALEWDFDSAMRANFEDGYTEGRLEGRAEGRAEDKEAVALKLIRMGLSFNDIHEATDLPPERIQQLAANLESEKTQ